jgi:hypothetical protein
MGQIHHAGPTRAAKLAHPSSPPSAAAKWARVPVEPTCRPRPSVRPHLSGDFSPISPACACTVVVGNPPLPRPVPSPSMPTDVAAEPPRAARMPSGHLVPSHGRAVASTLLRSAPAIVAAAPPQCLRTSRSMTPSHSAHRWHLLSLPCARRRAVHSHTHRAPA